jgi:hypothetical protein
MQILFCPHESSSKEGHPSLPMELSQTTTSKFSGSFMIAEEFFWDGFGGGY